MAEYNGQTADTPIIEETTQEIAPISAAPLIKPSQWQERISISKRACEEWARASGANRFCDEYNGKYDSVWFHTRNKRIPVPPINEVFAYVQSDLSSTYSQDPYLTVNAKAGTTKSARLWEVILNYWWRELKIKDEIELEIMDKDLVGEAWHKVGYSVESEGDGENLKIMREGLYSKRVDWRHIYWNIGAQRPPYDCLWMAEKIILPLEQVKQKYPKSAKLEGMTDSYLKGDSYRDIYKNLMYKDDIKFACLYEIWDAQTKSIYLIADGLSDNYLTDPRPWPDYLEEFPYSKYMDYMTADSPRGMSAIAPWEPQILEKMVMLASAINHTKRFNRQMIVKRGAIDEKALDQFERGDDGAVIENSGTGDLAANVMYTQWGTLPPDFYLLIDRLDAIKREVHGQPEFDRGGVTKTGTRTIGELTLIKEGAKSRVKRKIDRLETHLENIARHMLAHLKSNFDVEQAVYITGEPAEEIMESLGENFDPQTNKVTFTPEEIQGEFDVEIKAGSTLPMDKSTRMQVLELILNNLTQAISQSPVSPVLMSIISQLLEDYDIKGVKEAYQMELQIAEDAKAQKEGETSVKDQKSMADAQKRTAQTRQILTETDIAANKERSRQLLEQMAGVPIRE